MVRVRGWLVLGYGSEKGVSVLICPSEPSRERFKGSHVINECRVINHHPNVGMSFYRGWFKCKQVGPSFYRQNYSTQCFSG